jgi:hypothetical protein
LLFLKSAEQCADLKPKAIQIYFFGERVEGIVCYEQAVVEMQLFAAERTVDDFRKADPDMFSIMKAFQEKIAQRNSELPFCVLEVMGGSLFELCIERAERYPETISEILKQIKSSGDRYKQAENVLIKKAVCCSESKQN